MARPESLSDIEIEQTEFASIDVEKIATDGVLMRAYATFMEGVQKAGGTVEVNYNSRVIFMRGPSSTELEKQLKDAQREWDMHKGFYDRLADFGEVEHDFQRNYARRWAEAEGMPFPPKYTPIDAFDAVIRDIEEVTAP